MPKRSKTNLDLADLTDAQLAAVPRCDLEALLRSVATAEAWTLPWSDNNTVVMAGDRWQRIESTALRCLQKVDLPR